MREGYTRDGIFENAENGSGDCSLEAVVRSAAERMIPGDLGMEVTEFRGRLPGERAKDPRILEKFPPLFLIEDGGKMGALSWIKPNPRTARDLCKLLILRVLIGFRKV
jgi:hypothetical protein